jgi:hypothetical protein
MMLFSLVAIAFICVCHGQPLEQFAVPLIDNQQAPLTAMIDTSKMQNENVVFWDCFKYVKNNQ